MPDDNSPDSRPENAYPPPSSAYPPPNTPPNTSSPSSNPYGTPPSNPYGAPSTPPNNPYAQQPSNLPPVGGYGTQPSQSNWQPPPPTGMGGYGAAPSPVNGQTIMIMGIISIFCFGIILGPISWVMANNALKTLDQYGDPLNQRSNVNTGRICGIVGTVLAALGIIGYIVSMVIGVAASGMHPSSY